MTMVKKWMLLALVMVATGDLCAAQSAKQQPSGQAGGNSTSQNVNVNVVNTPTVNVGTLPAVTIAPGPLTHMGVLPSKHVMLASFEFCSTKVATFSKTGEVDCFDLGSYPGQVLVITDWEWYATATAAGSTCYVGAGVTNLPFLSVAAAGPDLIATKSEHLTTGVVYGGNPKPSSNCGDLTIYMQGYLVPNQ